MNITDNFVLAPGVELLPARRFTAEFRRQAGARNGDYVLAHPRSRRAARLVDRRTAAVLTGFRKPHRIAEAIFRAGRALRENEAALLDEAFPLLQQLIREGVLVTERTIAAARLEAAYRTGDRIAGFEVRSCLHLMQDTELYAVRDAAGASAVLKITRPGRRPLGDPEVESAILRHLDGKVSPTLLAAGKHDDRRFLVMEWKRGVTAGIAAADRRLAASGPAAARKAVASLCASVATAYGVLHGQSVAHGDVHEGNVIVAPDGAVALVDFGLARRLDLSPTGKIVRGGHAYYLEPEYAIARLAGQPPPLVTARGEQYSIAAMLYALFVEAPYVDFSLDTEAGLRQIAESPMLPFSRRGVTRWPGFEAVLSRALQKDPARRYESMTDFAAELAEVVGSGDRRSGPRRHAGRGSRSHPGAAVDSREGDAAVADRRSQGRRRRRDLTERFLATTSGRSHEARAALLRQPTASVMHGAAGVAYVLYRLAALRDDPVLLADANAWIVDAASERRRLVAYGFPDEAEHATVRAESLYHGLAGVRTVEALVAHATGDFVTMRSAVRRLVAIGGAASDLFDLSLGLPGPLLGACLVAEIAPGRDLIALDSLMRAGDRWATRIAGALGGRARLDADRRRVNLGVAHGWAGALYALLRWNLVRGQRPAAMTLRRLDELADAGDRRGSGMRWAWRQRLPGGSITSGAMPGWCNGSAGLAMLWLEAYRATGEARLLELAELAAWDAWAGRDDPAANLCCGLAGQAYAMFAVARATGDDAWMARARRLVSQAIAVAGEDGATPALFKGIGGLALVQAEAEDPLHARMPLFEAEGWPVPAGALA